MHFLDLDEEAPHFIPKLEFSDELALSLHSKHGNKISVDFPSPLNNHSYVLRSKGWVGQIPLSSDIFIRIKPKVPISNLFRMLEYAYNLKSFEFLEGHIEVSSLEEVFENLASILAGLVIERARKGLYHDYIERQESLEYLRGRVHIEYSLRAALSGSARLICDYEEHTADLEDNRILAWSLYLLPKMVLQREDVRRRVAQAYRTISGSSQLAPHFPRDCIGRFYHRLNEDYRPMHGLCRFFLEHCGPGIEAGTSDFMPFLLDMPVLYEAFVAEWLKANLSQEMRLVRQYQAKLEAHGGMEFRIDLVITDATGNRVLAVLDTKYKKSDSPEVSDVAQVVAYATRMNTDLAILIYPSSQTVPNSVQVGSVKVHVFTFDLGMELDKGGALLMEELHKQLVIEP